MTERGTHHHFLQHNKTSPDDFTHNISSVNFHCTIGIDFYNLDMLNFLHLFGFRYRPCLSQRQTTLAGGGTYSIKNRDPAYKVVQQIHPRDKVNTKAA